MDLTFARSRTWNEQKTRSSHKPTASAAGVEVVSEKKALFVVI